MKAGSPVKTVMERAQIDKTPLQLRANLRGETEQLRVNVTNENLYKNVLDMSEAGIMKRRNVKMQLDEFNRIKSIKTAKMSHASQNRRANYCDTLEMKRKTAPAAEAEHTIEITNEGSIGKTNVHLSNYLYRAKSDIANIYVRRYMKDKMRSDVNSYLTKQSLLEGKRYTDPDPTKSAFLKVTQKNRQNVRGVKHTENDGCLRVQEAIDKSSPVALENFNLFRTKVKPDFKTVNKDKWTTEKGFSFKKIDDGSKPL